MSAIRRGLKRTAEGTLGSPGAVRFLVRRLRGARLILSYHNIIADERPSASGDRSLHLPIASFREQLDELESAGIGIVALSDSARTPSSEPVAAITFDDAYAGVFDLALPELRRRGLPSTVFVAPGLLGTAGTWWDRLASPETGAVPERMRIEALASLHGDGKRILAHAAERGWPLFPPSPKHRIASADELAEAVQSNPLLTVGAHSWSHSNLAAVSGQPLVEEMTSPMSWLGERFRQQLVPWLAFPYGLYSASAQKAAAEAGYHFALRVDGGWDRGGHSAYAVPRLNITSGLSRAGFRLRLAGMFF